jgi:hypothetical protein
MSGFGAGEFDAQEGMERRIQEEIRARQASAAAAASRVGGALGHAGFSNTGRSFMSSLLAAESAASTGTSPYYAQRAAAAGAHSPFSRPYGALGSAYGAAHSPSDAVAASLYARQRAQYGYGGAAATAAESGFHGYGVPQPHDIYSQHFGRSSQEMSLIDRAAAYNAQQRQAENAAMLQQQQQTPTGKSPGASGLSANTLSYMQKGSPKLPSPKASTPRQTPQTPSSSTPVSTSSPANRSTPQHPRPRVKTPTSTATPMRPTSSEKEKSKATEEPVDDIKWFSGCVPLGLEDDKYWLSELQVYLRSNFAEAFGATEEDIAAPMHGRNKPIALGQVGIRCMHCKRKFFEVLLLL